MILAKRFLAPLGFLMMATLAVTAAAEEDYPMAAGGERHLNGHGFMPSIYVGTPFVSTVFQNHVGGGMASDLQTSFKDQDGNELFVLEGDLFFAALGMGYQQKLGSKWTVGCGVSGLVRSGTNAQSFVVEGADVNRRGSLWTKYLLYRKDQSQMALGLDWSYNKTVYFTPGDFARYIADGGSIEDAPIVMDTKIWTTRATVHWARAFSPAFGMRLSGEFGLYEVPETSGIFTGSHRLGILGEYDLKPTKAGWPLGITLGYTQNLPDDDPFTGLSGLLLGFWYTGKEEFVIGVETGSMNMTVANQETDKLDSMFAIFTIQYFF